MAEGEEFGAAATLAVDVDQRSLAEARAEVEEELGDVSVGVGTDSGPAAIADGGGASSMAALDGVGDELSEQTDLLEDIRDEIEAGGFGGGGGGGGGLPTILPTGKGGAGGGALAALMAYAPAAAGAGAGLFGGNLALDKMTPNANVPLGMPLGPNMLFAGLQGEPLGGGSLFGGGSKLPGGGEGGPIFGGGPMFGGGPWLAGSPAETTGILGGGDLLGGGPILGGGPLLGSDKQAEQQAEETAEKITITDDQPNWVTNLLDGTSSFIDNQPEWFDNLSEASQELIEGDPSWVNSLNAATSSLSGDDAPAWVNMLANTADQLTTETAEAASSGVTAGVEGAQEAVSGGSGDASNEGRANRPERFQIRRYEGPDTTTREDKPENRKARPNRAREGPSQSSQANVTVNNDVTAQLSIDRIRELNEFLRNPERFINDRLGPRGGVP